MQRQVCPEGYGAHGPRYRGCINATASVPRRTRSPWASQHECWGGGKEMWGGGQMNNIRKDPHLFSSTIIIHLGMLCKALKNTPCCSPFNNSMSECSATCNSLRFSHDNLLGVRHRKKNQIPHISLLRRYYERLLFVHNNCNSPCHRGCFCTFLSFENALF